MKKEYFIRFDHLEELYVVMCYDESRAQGGQIYIVGETAHKDMAEFLRDKLNEEQEVGDATQRRKI